MFEAPHAKTIGPAAYEPNDPIRSPPGAAASMLARGLTADSAALNGACPPAAGPLAAGRVGVR